LPLREAQKMATKRKLVVIVPGIRDRYRNWQPLCRRLQKELGFKTAEAVWIGFDHGIGILSIGNLHSEAHKLCARVRAEWIKADGFDEVVLVGHSLGGLLVRQAVLIAVGATHEDQPMAWGAAISRIILLASINRGIDTERKFEYRVFAKLLTWIYRLFPFLPHPTFLDALKGSAFLANLRIAWIRLFLSDTAKATAFPRGVPPIVQLLGDTDNLVWQEDSKDVLAFPNGHYIEVPNSDHKSIYVLESAPDPELRYAVLRNAFLGSFPHVAKPPSAGPQIDRVIFLLHGIRASNVADWIRGLEVLLNARRPLHTRVIHPTYGYFTAIRFALPSVRRRNIELLQDWYTEELAQHPDADFSVIAHSNGTYMLGQALARVGGMKFKNVVLAGSVLPEDFWARTKKVATQVGRVRNDRANRDWPVALLCSALHGLRMRDVGTGGFGGFLGSMVEEVAYHEGDHGEALKPGNQSNLAAYVFDQPLLRPANLPSDPGYYRQLSNLMPYIARGLVLLVIIAIALLVFQGAVFHPLRAVAIAGCLLVLYIILDII